MQHIHNFLRIFTDLQKFFYIYPYKRGIKWRRSWVHHIQCKSIFIWDSEISLCSWLKVYFLNFLPMITFITLFRCCPTFWKSALIPHCFNQYRNRQRLLDVAHGCKFQRWHTQRYFNVDLTLFDVATSYQTNNNVKRTFKYLLGSCSKEVLVLIGLAIRLLLALWWRLFFHYWTFHTSTKSLFSLC